MNIQHKELAQGRWAQMSFCEQMANIGSEVSRALNWRAKGRDDISKNALSRALELLSLTLPLNTKYSRLKELLRTKEALLDFFYGSNEYSSTETSWRRYFDQFNRAARQK